MVPFKMIIEASSGLVDLPTLGNDASAVRVFASEAATMLTDLVCRSAVLPSMVPDRSKLPSS